jgi:hypothetical protein
VAPDGERSILSTLSCLVPVRGCRFVTGSFVGCVVWAAVPLLRARGVASLDLGLVDMVEFLRGFATAGAVTGQTRGGRGRRWRAAEELAGWFGLLVAALPACFGEEV